MPKLPFVVEPRLKPITERVGSEESGQIEIERRGYLATGEKAFTSNASSSDKTSELILSTVRKVASKYKIDAQEAYQLVTGTITGSENGNLVEKIQKDFTSELGEIAMSASTSIERMKFIKAFCMVLYRVDATCTAEDIMQLHPDLLEGLAGLYDEEEARSIERLLESMEDEKSDLVEDVAKK